MNHTSRLALGTAVAGLLLVAGCSSSGSLSGTPSPSVNPMSSSATPSSAPPATAPATTPPAAAVPRLPAGYQPLYPFATGAAVQAWQASYASGGHQPWHLSASRTALSFTMGYLGYSGVNQVVSQSVGSAGATVTVGYKLPNGHLASSAVIHLLRFGTGQPAPWEVVGTNDTALTLDLPGYGTVVSSPATVGGKITGVDENLRAEVRQLPAPSAVGSFCCQAAGGQRTPWSLKVAFSAPSGRVLTIAVSTGGHVAAVERFAVTGVVAR